MNKTEEVALNLIKKWEGCKLEAYFCSAGVATIGYGHTQGVKIGDKLQNTYHAEELLRKDLPSYAGAVYNLVKELNLNHNQKGALISFAFNLGTHRLKNSTLLKVIQKDPNNMKEIQKQWLRWIYVGKTKLKGLENRRKDEFETYATKA